MQKVIILLVFIFQSIVGEDKPTYTTKYDNVDLDEILSSERLLTGYVKCLLDQGPCTPDGNELKSNLPDAIGNDCKKCTPRQKEGSDRVMEYIIDHRPDDWVKLEQKYNSDGSYKMKYLKRKEAAEKGKENNNDIEEDDDDDEDEKDDHRK